ncbi:phosphatidylserine decarboxylase-domain-containing protein [Aspergillus avenaceus]|uniref:Phosphatidylserine decarboxylase-domain-containing protein n=1 Tax=Aspergillus avenaceus TaxID=36643 RepID=A0A5N6TEW0_ASPAV|nr:phosphatidylserine decarboxylase-domain-containing protein [Aspergillus avenaceus]
MATTAANVSLPDSFRSKDHHKTLDRYHANLITRTRACRGTKFHPSVQALQNLIEHEPGLEELANSMLKEIPPSPTYDLDPSGHFPRMKDYMEMLQCFNYLLFLAPEWDHDSYKSGLVGLPFNALLNWPLATPSGHEFFLNDKVNRCVEDILNVHGAYLQDPNGNSKEALPSWFRTGSPTSPGSLDILTEKACPSWSDGKKKTFDQIFVTDPSDKYKGFDTWNAFFTRKFRPGIRPVDYPDKNHYPNEESKRIITNACESIFYHCATFVERDALFWLKGQPYSLENMLDGHFVDRFVHGTVYQAWLSPESYHRWHAPVSGTIKKAIRVPGTYFAGLKYYGFPEIYGNPNIPDPSAPDRSQSYITAMSTRALIFIEADNPDIGLMCFMAIGMVDVSSCKMTVKEGQQVMKGEELGMFQIGGSSYCLVFQPQVQLDWTREAQLPFDDDKSGLHSNIPVNKWLAVFFSLLWRYGTTAN